MTKNLGIVLGVYGIIVFVVFLYKFMAKLEEGLVTGDAFTAGIGAGIIWPVSLLATFWN